MKKIMSFALLAGISIFSINNTYAQDAKQILQKVSSQFGNSKGVKSNFTLKFADSKGTVKTTQTGTILLKGNKYKVVAGNQHIITDGKTTWTYNKKDNEVQIDKANNDAAMSPAKLFSGSYEKDYNYKYVTTKTVNKVAAYVIELTPKTAANNSIKKIEIMVNKANNQVVGGKVYEKTGNTIDYTLSGTTTNTTIPDSEFTFNTNAHKGVDVIDLR